MQSKVVNENFKDLSEAVAKCWEGHEDVYDWKDIDVAVTEGCGNFRVEVSRSYEYLPLTFDIMMKLAKIFGTMEYRVNNWSQRGCETCDYGSKYCHEFEYAKA